MYAPVMIWSTNGPHTSMESPCSQAVFESRSMLVTLYLAWQQRGAGECARIGTGTCGTSQNRKPNGSKGHLQLAHKDLLQRGGNDTQRRNEGPKEVELYVRHGPGTRRQWREWGLGEAKEAAR